MRRSLLLGISLAGLVCGHGSLAGTEPGTRPPTVVAGAAAHAASVAVSYLQQPNLARVNFFIGDLPTPVLRNTPVGVELSVATNQPLRLSEYSGRVREVASVSSRA